MVHLTVFENFTQALSEWNALEQKSSQSVTKCCFTAWSSLNFKTCSSQPSGQIQCRIVDCMRACVCVFATVSRLIRPTKETTAPFFSRSFLIYGLLFRETYDIHPAINYLIVIYWESLIVRRVAGLPFLKFGVYASVSVYISKVLCAMQKSAFIHWNEVRLANQR